MSCGRSAGDSGATDDSIDAESFHNGSIGSGGNLTKTHGSFIRSNASKTILQRASHRCSNLNQLHNSLASPAKSYSEDRSGVLIGEKDNFSHIKRQSLHESTRPLENVSSAGASLLRPKLVTSTGSPLARAMRSNHPNASLRPTAFANPSLAAGQGDLGSAARSVKVVAANPGPMPSANSWVALDCDDPIYRTPTSALHAHCRTATPDPSENGASRDGRCQGCWSGCHECCSTLGARRQFGEEEEVYKDREDAREPPPVLLAKARGHGEDRVDFGPSMGGKPRGAAPNTAIASGLSKTRPMASLNKQASTDVISHGLYPTAQAGRREKQKVMTSTDAHGQMLSARDYINLSAVREGIKDDFGAVEQRLSEQIDIMNKEIGRFEHPGELRSQGGFGYNNVASIVAGGTNGCDTNSTDRDLRDLNKQVVRMNLYEKFKREQSVTDQLARIERMLVTKDTASNKDFQHIAPAQETTELRNALRQQRHEML